MNTARQDHRAYSIALPTLSNEAVVKIRNFIEHVLDQFDVHYAPQVRRFTSSGMGPGGWLRRATRAT